MQVKSNGGADILAVLHLGILDSKGTETQILL